MAEDQGYRRPPPIGATAEMATNELSVAAGSPGGDKHGGIWAGSFARPRRSEVRVQHSYQTPRERDFGRKLFEFEKIFFLLLFLNAVFSI